MADRQDPREFIGREAPRKPLVIEPSRVQDFLDAIGESNPPFRLDSSPARFTAPIVPPTFLSVVRPGADPELAVPRFGTPLNAGNEYRWLKPVHAGESLYRQNRIVDVYQRTGRTGALTFFVYEITVTRENGEVVATARSTSVQREG